MAGKSPPGGGVGGVFGVATDEFARYGVAGSRIDRIARRAKTSKERLYAHFRGKQQLYRFIAERELAAMTATTRLDATDLPGYAGQVHDHFVAHPDHLRLLQWGRLDIAGIDESDDPFHDAVRQTVREGVEQLRQAQLAGYLDPAWDPFDIMALVNQIALTWAGAHDLVDMAEGQVRDPSPAARRAAVVAAVAGLFPAVAAESAPPTIPGTEGTTSTAVHGDRGVRSCASG
ncbi:TetR family transcriptional regulator [Nocardia sienata]|uniref:TetR family transcriptional regulator n=1 Tax=Nocardia sienata TaxID=248552 RepID=UPI0009FC782C|nr:TetR family transcriptional regulator [Nocardia sienata]